MDGRATQSLPFIRVVLIAVAGAAASVCTQTMVLAQGGAGMIQIEK